MENFCSSQDNEQIINGLYSAISSKGAFRRFKDKVNRLGLRKQWESFREEAFKEIAIEWCKQNDILYI